MLVHRFNHTLNVDFYLFIGTIADRTGDYRGSFFLAGSVMRIAGAMCFPLRRILKWENRRKRVNKTESIDATLPTDLEFDVL